MAHEFENAGKDEGPVSPERRAALASMGKFAGVTAPAVVALLTSDASEAWATSGKGGRPARPGRPERPNRRRRFF